MSSPIISSPIPSSLSIPSPGFNQGDFFAQNGSRSPVLIPSPRSPVLRGCDDISGSEHNKIKYIEYLSELGLISKPGSSTSVHSSIERKDAIAMLIGGSIIFSASAVCLAALLLGSPVLSLIPLITIGIGFAISTLSLIIGLILYVNTVRHDTDINIARSPI